MNDRQTDRLSKLSAWLWRTRLDAVPAHEAALLGATRLAFVLVRDLAQGQLPMRAMSLVYTTLLSLVPLLALSFSVLKGFGVHNQVEPVLLVFLAPLGESSAEVARRIIGFIDQLNVGVLGSIGLVLLIYTVVSLLQKIEESVNYIWHVAQMRRFTLRVSGYLTVLLMGPVLAFAVLGTSKALSKTAPVRELLATEPLGGIVHALGSALPTALAIAIFTLVYFLIPNTRVRAGSALAGGAVAGALWQVAAWGFASFAAQSTQYAAIYSSLAILVLFLIWLYINWIVLLLGASIAFYRQHPEYLIAPQGEPRLSNRMRERVALLAMYLIAKSYRDGDAAWSFAALTQRLGVPTHALAIVLDALQGAGLLVQIEGDAPAYLPARDPDTITVRQLLETVRSAGEDRFLGPASLPAPMHIESLLEMIERAAGERIGGLTLRELAATGAAETAGREPGQA